ncbi:amino acid permease [Exophiala viscosa]|uniref:amino acid permease n=1 Tax=Exophiala viscosa TaxID=2486360 RepID=UPI00218DE80C|nr:amino acid permease [Exophiala viscosa]
MATSAPGEKFVAEKDVPRSPEAHDVEHGHSEQKSLARNLQGRHMQMIAIGGSIGAGLFVGSGSSLQSGGPASLVIGFIVIGIMLLCTVQALGELAVLYPINGAFYQYGVRFIDPAWGFAMGWQYAIGWLLTLPFEITAAGITISYWHEYNIAIWIVVFLTTLIIVQFFGVRGYGEVEFVLGVIKVVAVLGFIIFGIIVDCGGIPGDHRGYIGFRCWNDSANGNVAFRNGFKGFCSVFVNAAFAFGGTELVGLAAAEAADPRKSLPKATKQVFWRIAGFYVVSLLIMGLIVPNSSPDLLNSSGANTKASPFVLAIVYAGVKGLPSVFNAVITISVMSVANSCTYGSTRTMQALAQGGMGPKWLAWIDKKGRPVWPVVIQMAFGLLAFINEAETGSTVFNWLLALTGLSSFFVWGSICLSHIRFRHAWKAAGRSVDDLPFKSQLGVIGSYVGCFLVVICLMGTFYISLFPIGGSPNAEAFFESYIAAPIVIALFLFWKTWTRDWSFGVKLRDVDLDAGRRDFDDLPPTEPEQRNNSIGRRLSSALF